MKELKIKKRMKVMPFLVLILGFALIVSDGIPSDLKIMGLEVHSFILFFS